MKKIVLFIVLVFTITSCSICNTNEKKVDYYVDKVIFIDPGHGGNDNGTNYNNIFEDDLNLKISSILYEMMINDNYTCYLTRTSDYDLSSMYSKNHKLDDLNKRIKMIDSLKATLFISLHLNYYPSDIVNGIQVFYQKNNQKSYQLATILQNNLNKENSKDKKCFIGDYYLLNNTKSSGVLIEYGFLSNEKDRKKLLNEKYMMHLAKIIKKSIEEYLGI